MIELYAARASDLLSLNIADSGWTERQFLEELHLSWAKGLTAWRDGKPVGIVFYRQSVELIEITMILVDISSRRLGVGKSILEKLIAEFRVQGIERILLEVRISNAAACGLYASFGFKEIGRRSRYYAHPDEDALILEKTIA